MRLILAFSFFFLLFSCKENPASKASDASSVINNYEDITVAKAQELLASNVAKPLDVRTPGEIADGKIAGAIEIDFRQKDFETKISALDKNTPYIVYCKSGGRSAKASKLMSKAGFTKVYNMLGGYSDWPQ